MITIIPALPNYTTIFKQEDGTLNLGDSVIAWKINSDGSDNFEPEPITLHGNESTVGNFYGVLTPVGTVITIGSQTFSCMEGAQEDAKRWVAHMKSKETVSGAV